LVLFWWDFAMREGILKIFFACVKLGEKYSPLREAWEQLISRGVRERLA
jgi:Na+/glutamate symporter